MATPPTKSKAPAPRIPATDYYLSVFATEQTSPSSKPGVISNADQPAQFTIRLAPNDHEIRQFRRDLPKIIAALVKPGVSNLPSIDIFFKRFSLSHNSDPSESLKSSKVGFEAKVKNCILRCEPLMVAYKLREEVGRPEATVSSDNSHSLKPTKISDNVEVLSLGQLVKKEVATLLNNELKRSLEQSGQLRASLDGLCGQVESISEAHRKLAVLPSLPQAAAHAPSAATQSVTLSTGATLSLERAYQFMDFYCDQFDCNQLSIDLYYRKSSRDWAASMFVDGSPLGDGTVGDRRGQDAMTVTASCYLETVQKIEADCPSLFARFEALHPMKQPNTPAAQVVSMPKSSPAAVCTAKAATISLDKKKCEQVDSCKGAGAVKQGTEAAGTDNMRLDSKARSIASYMKDFLSAYDTLMGPEDGVAVRSDGFTGARPTTANSSTIPKVINEGEPHPHIYCDGPCDAAIKGTRWKCVLCPDWDYCDACYPTEVHKHLRDRGDQHLFLAIHKPLASYTVNTACQKARKQVLVPGYSLPARTSDVPNTTVSPRQSTPPVTAPSSPSGKLADPTVTPSSHQQTGVGRVSVQFLQEDVPASSELTAEEKTAIAQKIMNAGGGIEEKIKTLLGNAQAISENCQGGEQFVVDIDYLTRKQYKQILVLLGEEAVDVTTSSCSPEVEVKECHDAKNSLATRVPAEHKDGDDEQLPFDCTLTTAAGGKLIIATNTGTKPWDKMDTELHFCWAGAEWVSARCTIVGGDSGNSIPPSGQLIWGVNPACTFSNRPQGCKSGDMYFKMATEVNGRPRRFGEQLLMAGPVMPCSMESTATALPTPTANAKSKTSEALNGSSVLTIPAAPEMMHTDEEAILAASIPSDPSYVEANEEFKDAETQEGLCSQSTGRTDLSQSEPLRSPSYQGGSTCSERDPFEVIGDEGEEDDAFIVIDASTDEESVAGV